MGATACNKANFNGGVNQNSNADCRTNPGFSGHLFSWCAVARFADTLCPYPWRVPSRQDFIDLDIALGGTGVWIQNAPHFYNYFNTWGGVLGQGWGGNLAANSGNYWSSDQCNADLGYSLSITSQHNFVNPQTNRYSKRYGLSLRCVRDN